MTLYLLPTLGHLYGGTPVIGSVQHLKDLSNHHNTFLLALHDNINELRIQRLQQNPAPSSSSPSTYPSHSYRFIVYQPPVSESSRVVYTYDDIEVEILIIVSNPNQLQPVPKTQPLPIVLPLPEAGELGWQDAYWV